MRLTFEKKNERLQKNGPMILEVMVSRLDDFFLQDMATADMLMNYQVLDLMSTLPISARCARVITLLRSGPELNLIKFCNILREKGLDNLANHLDSTQMTREEKRENINGSREFLKIQLVTLLDDQTLKDCKRDGILVTIEEILSVDQGKRADMFLEHLEKTSVDNLLSFVDIMKKKDQNKIADILENGSRHEEQRNPADAQQPVMQVKEKDDYADGLC